MRLMSLHGLSKDAWKRYTSSRSWYYEVVAPGFKYNLTDIVSALGRAQLTRANALWQQRCSLAIDTPRRSHAYPAADFPSRSRTASIRGICTRSASISTSGARTAMP